MIVEFEDAAYELPDALPTGRPASPPVEVPIMPAEQDLPVYDPCVVVSIHHPPGAVPALRVTAVERRVPLQHVDLYPRTLQSDPWLLLMAARQMGVAALGAQPRSEDWCNGFSAALNGHLHGQAGVDYDAGWVAAETGWWVQWPVSGTGEHDPARWVPAARGLTPRRDALVAGRPAGVFGPQSWPGAAPADAALFDAGMVRRGPWTLLDGFQVTTAVDVVRSGLRPLVCTVCDADLSGYLPHVRTHQRPDGEVCVEVFGATR